MTEGGTTGSGVGAPIKGSGAIGDRPTLPAAGWVAGDGFVEIVDADNANLHVVNAAGEDWLPAVPWTRRGPEGDAGPAGPAGATGDTGDPGPGALTKTEQTLAASASATRIVQAPAGLVAVYLTSVGGFDGQPAVMIGGEEVDLEPTDYGWATTARLLDEPGDVAVTPGGTTGDLDVLVWHADPDTAVPVWPATSGTVTAIRGNYLSTPVQLSGPLTIESPSGAAFISVILNGHTLTWGTGIATTGAAPSLGQQQWRIWPEFDGTYVAECIFQKAV